MGFPINIRDLITGKTVEWDRIEFKAGWNPEEVLHSMCAFANDINNWGGGYIIVGIEEKDGLPILPPKGIHHNQVDKIQKELLGLTHKIDPFYAPVTEPVAFQGCLIFIIWVPGGQTRPYKSFTSLAQKGQKQYYIRRGSNSVIANHTEIKQLMELAATVPFDDRTNHNASLADLDLGLMREFLQDIKSDLFDHVASIPFEQICQQMRVVSGPEEYIKPVNAGLLFFNRNPEKFFRGAITEIILFKDGQGTTFTEKRITGPLHHQIRAALDFIKNTIIAERVIKVTNRAEANRFYNYPFGAVEEALVNAYYHRSYEHQSSVEINIHPDKIEILSFPGPLPPITKEALKKKRVVSRDYRNRRIGDFLKELDLTEGRGTGLPKIYQEMDKNGSPLPLFETDEDRTSFLAILPVHPYFNLEKAKEVKLSPSEHRILYICYRQPSATKELAFELKIKPTSGALRRSLDHLLHLKLIEYTIPDKPNSRFQKYRLTALGQAQLSFDDENDPF